MPSQKPLAVVTASTAGIGLSTALSLAKRGFHVIVSSRNAANVTASINLINSLHGPNAASGITCHIGKSADRAALLAFVRQRGSVIKALVLNAAVSTAFGKLFDISELEWDKMFNVNLKATFFFVKECMPMLKRGSSVTIVTSIAGFNALPGLGAYSISKTALLGMCKVMSGELAPKGIRANAVAPGLIQTKFSEKLWKDGSSDDTSSSNAYYEKFTHIPMGRVGQPDEIGSVISFLASDEASYVTGETVIAAGGVLSRL